MGKPTKIAILILIFIAVGVGGYLGYKALNPNQYQQQAIKDLNNKMTQLYFDKSLASEESDKAILDFQEGSGQRTPPFKTVSTTRLSKGTMRKIDARIDRCFPGFKGVWFAQIELKDGGYDGYFIVESHGRKACYRRLSGGDPMYGIVVEDHQIITKK